MYIFKYICCIGSKLPAGVDPPKGPRASQVPESTRSGMEGGCMGGKNTSSTGRESAGRKAMVQMPTLLHVPRDKYMSRLLHYGSALMHTEK